MGNEGLPPLQLTSLDSCCRSWHIERPFLAENVIDYYLPNAGGSILGYR